MVDVEEDDEEVVLVGIMGLLVAPCPADVLPLPLPPPAAAPLPEPGPPPGAGIVALDADVDMARLRSGMSRLFLRGLLGDSLLLPLLLLPLPLLASLCCCCCCRLRSALDGGSLLPSLRPRMPRRAPLLPLAAVLDALSLSF